MRKVIGLFFFLFSTVVWGQNSDSDLMKYWKMRDALRTRFSKVGSLKGESMPASVIIPHRQYGQSDQSTGSVIQWRDATISLGYYIAVLSMEYRLLSQTSENTDATLTELYYALFAFNRLDISAEEYLSGNAVSNGSQEDLNGFFIRGDQTHLIVQNWQNDPPLQHSPFLNDSLHPDPGHPNQMRSDFQGWKNYDSGGPEDDIFSTDVQPGSSESLDQMITVCCV
jgi:hypothetical protein